MCNVAKVDADNEKYAGLTRNFVADAAEKASASVVNILCPVYGMMMSGMSTGSGFVISKVIYRVYTRYLCLMYF